MENSAASLLSTADFDGTVAVLTREFKGSSVPRRSLGSFERRSIGGRTRP